MFKLWFYFIFTVSTIIIVTRCNGNVTDDLKISKPEKVLWFIRKFSCPNSECKKNFDSWKEERFKEIKEEWESKANLIGEISHKKLWIPLNGADSMQIENIWREQGSCIKNCKLSGNYSLSDGLYVSMIYGGCGYLKPIYWQNENSTWLLLRSERVYEVPHPPPVLYFMNIEGNATMESYWQPVPSWLHSKANDYDLHIHEGNLFTSTFASKATSTDHLIFVIHGIGHQEGEEGIVKNAYTIRKGFIKYLKKFHPTFKIPTIIPVPWRFNLTLNDETLRVTPLTKFNFIKKAGFVLNDVFYYWSKMRKKLITQLVKKLNSQYEIFKTHNSNFSGNVSLLAHSLGSALAFDLTNLTIYQTLEFEIENIFLIGSPLGKFLASKNVNIAKLRQNPWIKNGKIFNILNSNDPIAHRLEVLFNTNYSYAAPSNLFFHKNFRASYEKSIKTAEMEKEEVQSFHRYIIDDRAMAISHDSFLTVDYLAYGYEFDEKHLNVCSSNVIFQGKLDFLQKIFYGRKILNDSKIVKPIPFEKRIPHRFDFDLYKSEYYRQEEDFEDSYILETELIQWMKDFGYAHISYWKRPELIAFMTNVIFNYTPEVRYPNLVSSYDDPYNKNFQKGMKRTHGLAWKSWKCVNHAESEEDTVPVLKVSHEPKAISEVEAYCRIILIGLLGPISVFFFIFMIKFPATVIIDVLKHFSITLLILLGCPDILAEVGWNFRELLSKVSPTLNFSSWLIYGIYIAIFVLSFLNLVITERPYNLHTVHRIIYNYVLILMILWLIILGIRVLSVKIRNHDLECVHSDIEGYCREYIMYDNRTNTHVASRIGEEESASWYN
uniref:DDHD domain-containing protein n=1 Tax=Panagrolaimus sp. PS1159 TaxID=55785 RepID=A0AC35EWA2_9BILA